MDHELVLRAKEGDRDAFTRLVDAIGGRLHAIAYAILRDHELAHDATQSTLLDAWKHLGKLRDPGRFEAWTYRILVRACHAEARRARRWQPSSLDAGLREPVVVDGVDLVADRDQIDRAFRQLNVDQRAAIVLVYYRGLTPAQAAEALGVPLGTVQSRVFRALRLMRAALEADARRTTQDRHGSPSGEREEALR